MEALSTRAEAGVGTCSQQDSNQPPFGSTGVRGDYIASLCTWILDSPPPPPTSTEDPRWSTSGWEMIHSRDEPFGGIGANIGARRCAERLVHRHEAHAHRGLSPQPRLLWVFQSPAPAR